MSRGVLLCFVASVLIGCADSPVAPYPSTEEPQFSSAVTPPARRAGLLVDSLWTLVQRDSLVIVGLKNPGTPRGMYRGLWHVTPHDVERYGQLLERQGFAVVRQHPRQPAVVVRVETLAALAMLNAFPFIDYAEPSYILIHRAEPGCAGDDQGFYEMPLTSSRYPTTYDDRMPDSFYKHNIDLAWRRSKGEGIRIGIVDTGIDPGQPELNELFATGESIGRRAQYGASSDSGNDPEWYDDCGHGTRMAGLAAGPMNGSNTVGVAFRSNLVAVRQDDDVAVWSAEDASDAINLAALTYGSRIIVMAWGSTDWSNLVSDEIEALYHGLNDRLFVGAAGTSSCSDVVSHNHVLFPARMSEVVAVTAIHLQSNSLACNAHYGEQVDVAAYVPNLAPGAMSLGLGEVVGIAGTSAASAIIGGIAALVWATDPTMARDEVVLRLKQAGSNYPEDSEHYGAGWVDAYAAVGGMSSITGRILDGSPVRVGISETFRVDIVGGTMPFEYAFTSHNPQTYYGQWTRTLSHTITFTTAGTHTVSFTVTDRSDGVVKAGSATIDVGPGPTVRLSGPDVVETKGYYTFTASASNFYSPTYAWYFRNCATCAWSALTNNGSTLSPQLTPACTSAEDRYYLKVRVRDGYGADVTQTNITELCAADAPPAEF